MFKYDEDQIKFYDDLNISYGTEEEKEQIEQELTEELGDILDKEELEAAIANETKYLIPNKNVRVRLLEDYTKWAESSKWKKGAEGIVKDWKFFRFHGRTWQWAYVYVEIGDEGCAVNIDKLEVLDEDFLKAEEKFFKQFKDTYVYIPTENLLRLDDDIELHCTSLINRILGYLEN